MAKLLNMPSEAVISGFRKTIDFCYWRGIPYARTWPSYKSYAPTQAVLSSNSRFAYAARQWLGLSEVMRDAYNHMAMGSDMSGRDLFTSAYLSNIYREPI